MGAGSLAVLSLFTLHRIVCHLLLGGKLWAGKCHPKPAYSLNIALLISRMYITLKLVAISDIFLMLAYLAKTFKVREKKQGT